MTFNKIRRSPFVTDLAKRDGFLSMDAYRYERWGKSRCEYYVKEGPSHPNYPEAKLALEFGKNNEE